MLALLRTLHVLSVAVWFGAVVFFGIAALLIFQTFADISSLPDGKRPRPLWFPLPDTFSKESPGEGFPEPLRLEQGSRAAGEVASRLFPVYFQLQAGCAAVAVLTALGLVWKQGGKLNGFRLVVCVLGLAVVLAGWWLEQYVSGLRSPRNNLTDVVLKTPEPTAQQIEEAQQARSTFGKWHGISQGVNLATFVLALLATGLAAHLQPQVTQASAVESGTATR